MPLHILNRGLPRDVERRIDFYMGFYQSLIEEEIIRKNEEEIRKLARDFVWDVVRSMEVGELRPVYDKVYSKREKGVKLLCSRLIDIMHDKELVERMREGLADPVYGALVDMVRYLLEDTGYEYTPAVRVVI